jgi:hypothetical protein
VRISTANFVEHSAGSKLSFPPPLAQCPSNAPTSSATKLLRLTSVPNQCLKSLSYERYLPFSPHLYRRPQLPKFLGWPRCMHWIKRIWAQAAVQLSCAVFPILRRQEILSRNNGGVLGLKVTRDDDIQYCLIFYRAANQLSMKLFVEAPQVSPCLKENGPVLVYDVSARSTRR